MGRGASVRVSLRFAAASSQGTVNLQAQGTPGVSSDIAASEDLLNWLDLGSVLADTNGLMQFDDINAPPTPPVSTRPPRNN